MNKLIEKPDNVKTFVEKVLFAIDLENEVIDNEINVKAIPQIIAKTRTLLEELREFIHSYIFREQNEEIWFFKEGKPAVLSKLIYYNELYRIELGYPHGGKDVVVKYYKQRLQQISFFFNNHLDFYKYYRSKDKYLDKYYFLRGCENINLNHNYGMFDKDPLFSSCCDYLVAKILANDLLEVYLEQKIKDIDSGNYLKSTNQNNHKKQLRWTGSKVAAIELGYAIHSSGVLNNGNTDLKQIMSTIENVFDINLGDYYRTYLAMRERKKDRMPFLNSLINQLSKKMDNDDTY